MEPRDRAKVATTAEAARWLCAAQLPRLSGLARRYWLGAAFSSPSPIVLITVLYFSAIAIFQALVERFAFLDYANSLQDVGYLFGLNNDCLALCLASPSNASQFV